MTGYVTLGTNNFDNAIAFYDELLGSIDAKRLFEMEHLVAWSWSNQPTKPGLLVPKPFNGEPASVSNGGMVAFALESNQQVNNFYHQAIALSATSEGPPGPRKAIAGFYAAYFRYLDGNKLNAFHLEMPSK